MFNRSNQRAEYLRSKTRTKQCGIKSPEKKKASVRDSYKADPEKKKASVHKTDPKIKASVLDSYNAGIESKRSAESQRTAMRTALL